MSEQRSKGMKVGADCPMCGPVELVPADVRCALEAAGEVGLCEFSCSICGRTAYARTTAEGVAALRAEGAGGFAGTVPFELLEAHEGDPVGWDDLLDLLCALEGTPIPQSELAGAEAGILPPANAA